MIKSHETEAAPSGPISQAGLGGCDLSSCEELAAAQMSFECSSAHWTVRALHSLLQACSDSFCLSATSSCQYISQHRRGQGQCCSSLPVRPQQRIQAEPGRRGAVVSNVGRGDGKGWGEEGRDGKWRGTEGDLPLSLCGLFQFPWLFVWSEFSA